MTESVYLLGPRSEPGAPSPPPKARPRSLSPQLTGQARVTSTPWAVRVVRPPGVTAARLDGEPGPGLPRGRGVLRYGVWDLREQDDFLLKELKFGSSSRRIPFSLYFLIKFSNTEESKGR